MSQPNIGVHAESNRSMQYSRMTAYTMTTYMLTTARLVQTVNSTHTYANKLTHIVVALSWHISGNPAALIAVHAALSIGSLLKGSL